ncbi:hypothetical protein [Streptomyces sp. NPDC047070]|uniref:hypothetical protein n=1 Tax=Streptomyces sp. NPDC047070 TaxID=3154923 RepID=UPI003451A8DC
MKTPEVPDLGHALRALGEAGDRLLAFEVSREQLDELLADLDAARKTLLAVRAGLGPSGCRRHPHVPLDPTTGGECLLCAQNRRRGLTTAAAVEEAPLSVICQAIVTDGHEAAVARFGARAVTRAILHCRNDPEFLLEESA